MLNSIGYTGPISVEWEDAGMDRAVGAPDALAFVRRLTQIEPPAALARHSPPAAESHQRNAKTYAMPGSEECLELVDGQSR